MPDLRRRIPSRIAEPDRTWMALAAYNMGMGHLEDVRVITQKQGGDPDAWHDVRQRLELLTQERFYRDTRYGYARGHEARQYVDNIQSYYETLIWMDTREHPLLVDGLGRDPVAVPGLRSRTLLAPGRGAAWPISGM